MLRSLPLWLAAALLLGGCLEQLERPDDYLDDPHHDFDGDGYCEDEPCSGGALAGDCDDAVASVHPGAYEACDGMDSDCDGAVPDDEADRDGDGEMICDGDCNDGNALLNQQDLDGDGASSCDGDCNDANPDENLHDADGDGWDTCHGDCNDDDPDLNLSDFDLDGWCTCSGDCDDDDPDTWPGAPELCDFVDNDCDDSLPADEVDGDGDGFAGCEGDCDDASATVYPDAPELCDGVDNDCDPGTNEEADGDGDGYSECEGDCDDLSVQVGPAHVEICDGVDNDCDLMADEDCAACSTMVPVDWPTVQDALDNSLEGDLVCVEPGMYLENIGFLGPAIHVLGIAGYEWTTLWGVSTAPVVTFDHGEGADTILQGFTITNGDGVYGGGVFLSGASPTLVNLLITENDAEDGAGLYLDGASPTLVGVAVHVNEATGNGGGIYITGQSFPTLNGVLISSNVAGGYGGGVATVESFPSLTGVDVIGNLAGDCGGGIAVTNQSHATISDLLVDSNQGICGGGLYVQSSSMTGDDLEVTANWAGAGSGGGIYLHSCSVQSCESTITDARIEDNAATDRGGGLAIHGVAPLLEDLVIGGNTAGVDGGGVFVNWLAQPALSNVRIVGNAAGANGGGVEIDWWSSPLLDHVIIAGNTASNAGGGVRLAAWSAVDIDHCAVVGNSATDGAGLYTLNSSEVTMASTDVSANVASGASAGIHLETGTVVLSYSNVSANLPADFANLASPVGVDGNIAEDPQYLDLSPADALDWDLHLGAASALVDAGDPAFTDPSGGAPDVGAYGGPAAGSWDLDWDGYPEWWQPGPYAAGTYPAQGLDCDDLDAAVYPGNGC